MKFAKIFLLVFVFSLLLSGCPKKPRHAPSETRMGPTGERIDYVIAKDIDGSPLKLPLRDESFDARVGSGNRVEGLLPSVYFDFDQSYIRPAERDNLKKAIKHLKDNPGDRLLIEGYCDWRGTTEYNLALGDHRAKSVSQYLSQLDIDEGRMERLSRGDLEAEENASEEEMQKDRRADLIIVR